MTQVSRLVRPQERGPARPGLRWEVIGIALVAIFGWSVVIHAAGAFMGWW